MGFDTSVQEGYIEGGYKGKISKLPFSLFFKKGLCVG